MLKKEPESRTRKTANTELSRRQLLLSGAACGLISFAIPARATKHSTDRNIIYPDRSLSLFNVHTAEKETITFWSDGKYQQEGLNQINWIMRDFRTNDVKPIDPRLLNILYLLTRKLDAERPVQLLSGFRSKKTNDMLRKTTEGVARRSFHMAGRAMDIRIPRIATRDIQRAALRLGGGGVGYYPNSNFVHLDSGPVRTW